MGGETRLGDGDIRDALGLDGRGLVARSGYRLENAIICKRTLL